MPFSFPTTVRATSECNCKLRNCAISFCQRFRLFRSSFRTRNPGTKTIERDLLEALAKAEAFPDEMKLDLGKVVMIINYTVEPL